ncbi:MAG: hypothetical protein JWQ83_2251 [Lacunisphaera sp.]|nr:hypothetical protein [Lacunisphaera sp.]
MATEIYIRNTNETEARGPFNVDQVSSLAEAGQVTADTLIYDATTEQWVALATQAELMAAIFPEKKKLVLKAKEIKTLNKADENAKAITVNDMLAAAEGRTDETAGKADPQIAMMRAAKIGLIGATLTVLLAAAGEILPATDTLMSMDPAKLMLQPLVVLGVLDVVLTVLLGLGMATIYPFVRFRAAMGLGLMGFMFYAQGLSLPLLQVAAGSVGLYLCTVVISVIPAVVAAAAGVAGMGTLAWYFLSH